MTVVLFFAWHAALARILASSMRVCEAVWEAVGVDGVEASLERADVDEDGVELSLLRADMGGGTGRDSETAGTCRLFAEASSSCLIRA